MKTVNKQIRLAKNERIVAVVPEYASGPGWTNSPLFVYITDTQSNVRSVCLQPGQQTPKMLTLFKVYAVAHEHLLSAVDAIVYKEWK